MSADEISIKNAKPDKLFYVVANAVIVRETDGRCLILKRSEREIAYPGKWTIVGEKVEHKDIDINTPDRVENDVAVYVDPIHKILERGAMEEAAINIKTGQEYIADRVILRPDGIPVVLLIYKVKYDSGQVKPQAGDFTDFAWVNIEELSNYDVIKGVVDDIKTALD